MKLTGPLLLTLGLVVAFGWLPGAEGWAIGPRVGIATALLVLGALVVLGPLLKWLLRATGRQGDEPGNCPVGKRCGCGTFNFKPRTTCKACQAAVVYD